MASIELSSSSLKARLLNAATLFSILLTVLTPISAWTIWGRCDLSLLTSQNEGTPNALLEVMARGVPSVAFGVGAVPEIMADDCDDGLIDDSDEAAMLQRVQQLLGDPERARKLGDAQARRVNEELTFDASMRKYEELLTSLTN